MKAIYILPLVCLLFISSTLQTKEETKRPDRFDFSLYRIECPLSLYAYHPPSTIIAADQVEQFYSLPDCLLKADMLWESNGKLYATNKNRDGSIDRGPMQYNDRAIADYAKLYNNGELFEPYSTDSIVVAGKEILGRYRKLGTWRMAIQKRNAGEKKYADNVLKVYLRLKGMN